LMRLCSLSSLLLTLIYFTTFFPCAISSLTFLLASCTTQTNNSKDWSIHVLVHEVVHSVMGFQFLNSFS
jgi:hypothetical protein